MHTAQIKNCSLISFFVIDIIIIIAIILVAVKLLTSVSGPNANEPGSCINFSVSCVVLLMLYVCRSRASDERIMETSPLTVTACISSLMLLDGLKLNLKAGPALKVTGEISLWIISVCLLAGSLIEVN
jgi:hypothetical protein